MTHVNGDSVWHICITNTNGDGSIESSDGEYARSKVDVFNYLLWKKSNNYPYLIHSKDPQVTKDLKRQVCEYCQGRVWVYPFSTNQIKLLKLLATQLGFSVKIMVFCKHKVCIGNKPPMLKVSPKGVTYVNEYN